VTKKGVSAALLAIMLTTAAPAAAQELLPAPAQAIGADITYSADADETEVVRIGANFDWRYRGPEEYRGFRLERLWYSPQGQSTTTDDRVYFRIADNLDAWKYNASIGTDGDTVLGSAAIHNESRFRQEYFLERDKVETPLGVSQGIYYTFGGASVDVPLSEQSQLTLLGGLQKFTGSNLRTHLRANFTQVIEPKWGLSAQLRTRYFRNSDPGEYDYFSPRWYAEVLPVLQVRRFLNGWRYLAAGGWGVQRDSRSKNWRQSRYVNLRVNGPADRKGWGVAGDLTYSNMPITNSDAYHYLRFSFGLTRIF